MEGGGFVLGQVQVRVTRLRTVTGFRVCGRQIDVCPCRCKFGVSDCNAVRT